MTHSMDSWVVFGKGASKGVRWGGGGTWGRCGQTAMRLSDVKIDSWKWGEGRGGI